MRKRRLLAALLAALLLLTLAACQRETAPDPETPDEPAAQEPDTPADTQESEDSQDPEETQEPEDTQEPETDPAIPAGEAQVRSAGGDGYAGEGTQVAYDIWVPEVETGSDAADEIINAYYASQQKKLLEQAETDLAQRAAEEGAELALTADFTVMRNGDNLLSILRTVKVQDYKTGLEDTTLSAETFDLESGGLMTADAFFDADVGEETYTQRLVDCVRRQIREDPYHDQTYFAQWEDAAMRQFDRDRFYVTEDAYVVFYQQHQLGFETHVYEIPWSQLADLLA